MRYPRRIYRRWWCGEYKHGVRVRLSSGYVVEVSVEQWDAFLERLEMRWTQ